MKTNKSQKHLNSKKKALLFNSGLFLALFGITAGTTYLIIPKKGMAEDEDISNVDDPDNGDVTLTGKQRFISNLTNSATSGLNLKFDVLNAYFPGKDKDDASKGNLIDGKGTQVAFAMDEISLHGISLGLKAKLDYNGYKRQLSLAKCLDDIYFAINDLDNETYNFKYKASIEPKVTDERDETTGGILQYEYGDVDWIISDVLEILSNGGIKVDFPKIDLNSLSSSSDSSSGSSDEDGSNAMSGILSSLNDMEEDTAHSYLTWNLPLGGETLSIGFTYDSDYYLSGIDFPAKTFDGSEQGSYSIKNGDTLVGTIRASATVETGGEAISWTSFIPGKIAEYHDIKDSASLFRKVARYIANPQFGLKTTNSLNINSGNGLALTHYKKDGDCVTSDVIERASLNLSACADFSGGLQNFLADISFTADNASANISAAYLEDNAYLNIDDLLMAKVSKTNLDALFAKTVTSLSEDDEVEESVEEASAITDLISTVLDNFPTIKSFTEGHYEKAFDFIKSVDGADNNLSITFDLSPVKIDGEVTVNIDGTYVNEDNGTDTYLSGITFNSVKLSAFQLDGTLSLAAYSLPSVETSSYDELAHLPGIKNQIEEVTSSKEASLSLTGNVKTGKTDVLGNETGVSFSGNLGFSYDKKSAGVSLTANQVSKNYSQDHHFKFALSGDGTDFTETAFKYDSVNDVSIDSESGLDSEGKARTNPRSSSPVTGKMSISSMKDIISTIKSVIPEEEEDEASSFQKIASSIGGLVGGDLAGDLINKKYSGLFEKKILAEKASLGGDENKFVLNGDLFGLDENPVVSISYEANSEDANGGFKSLNFAMSKVSIGLGIEATKDVNETILNPLKGEDTSAYTDFNTVKTLVEYATGSTKLGRVASGDSSTYDISLNVALNIGKTKINLIGVSLNLRSEKDYVKAHLSIPYMPLIKGVNAPDSSVYFRDHEYEGRRAVDLYYSYKKGDTSYGDLYITRNSSYGKVTEVKDTVQLTGKDLIEKTGDEGGTYSYNGLGWLLEYVLGINESYLRKDNAPIAEEGTIAEASQEEGSNLFDNAFPHPEDFLKQYQYDETNISWSLGVDVGSLLDERALLGDAMISISGKNVVSSDASTSWKTLSSLNIGFNLVLGNPDGSHQIVPASAEIELALDNVSTGVYQNTWENASVNDFTSVVSYDDEGNVSFAYGDDYTKHYKKDGDSSFLPGNYYVGVTC